jgi:hypothetical protein
MAQVLHLVCRKDALARVSPEAGSLQRLEDSCHVSKVGVEVNGSYEQVINEGLRAVGEARVLQDLVHDLTEDGSAVLPTERQAGEAVQRLAPPEGGRGLSRRRRVTQAGRNSQEDQTSVSDGSRPGRSNAL